LKHCSCYNIIRGVTEMRIGGAQKPRKGQADPHTYREVTPRRAPKHAFLGRGSNPPKLIKDVLIVAAKVATTAAKPNGTCKILDR
jgi:hypothetical protein